MEKLRSFVQWMMIDPRHPEIAQAQYNELKTQIPLLYALLMVNAIAVSYTHYDAAPFYMTVGILGPMLVFTTVRLMSWIKSRKIVLGPEAAIRKMRQTVILGSLVAVVYISWSLSLDQYGGPSERGHVALFIAITVIGCIFCLMHLPQAALMVMFIVTVPYLAHYMRQGEDVYVAIAMNIFLVCLVVLQVLFNSYRGFCKLIDSQSALAVKQKETERLNAENERLAQTDALTDLPNRRYFFSRLDDLIEKIGTDNTPFAVGVVDLDRFKPINDTYGHQLGDQLLTEVGKRLGALARPDLEICRLGGDEFGFLFRGDAKDAERTGQNLCERITEPYRIGELQLAVGASCGIALYPEAGRTSHVLFDRSDYALYNSKTTSRGRTTVYSSEHEARIKSDRAIEAALQNADFAREFQVHFQPMVWLPERKIIGFEALARWNSPVLQQVGPNNFIPIAEKTGLIHRLTLLLFDKALAQITSLPGDLCLSFNLSAVDITSLETIEGLLEVIRQRNADPRLITFEVTETSVISSYDAAETCLQMLKNAGVKLALDDFGTGFSSLGYLHRLPIDCVKIDQSFVADIESPVACGVVTSIVNLCRSMQILCVIEGVEAADQLSTLEALECRLVQGYYFAPALPYDEIKQAADTGGKVAGLELSSLSASEIHRSSMG